MWNIFHLKRVSSVKDINKTFHNVRLNQIYVCYLEDKNCYMYVNLRVALMGELFRCVHDVLEQTERESMFKLKCSIPVCY